MIEELKRDRTGLRRRVLNYLRLNPGPASVAKIARELGAEPADVLERLRQMKAHGFVSDAMIAGPGAAPLWEYEGITKPDQNLVRVRQKRVAAGQWRVDHPVARASIFPGR